MSDDMSNHEPESNHTNASSASNTETNKDDMALLSHPSYQELMRKLNETEEKANQYWDRILRIQAENENALRRAERDIANAHKYALDRFVTELLPIVDSLELCTHNVPKEMQDNAQSILDGVHLTLKMFYAAMEKFGIKQLNPVSQPFDPEHHQAISTQVDSSVQSGIVLSVLQKGYILNNRLIRPALVIVSKEE